jgi:hypothetical protein
MPPAADQTNTVENELRVSKSLVAATLEKAKTYVFAETAIRDREVGGSNPLAPTIYFKLLRTAPADSSCCPFLFAVGTGALLDGAPGCTLLSFPTAYSSRPAFLHALSEHVIVIIATWLPADSQ